MHNAVRVRVIQDALLRQHLLQSCAFHELHGDVEVSVLLAGVVDGHDVGMVEQPGGPGFILKAPDHVPVLEPMYVQAQSLERHCAPDGRVLRFVHNAHGAASQLADNFVSANRLHRHGGLLS